MEYTKKKNWIIAIAVAIVYLTITSLLVIAVDYGFLLPQASC